MRAALTKAPTRRPTEAEIFSRARAAEQERVQGLGRTAPVFAQYRDDPCGFAEKVLKLRLWSKQRRILLAIAAGKNVAITSGQKTGKSTVFVAAALWWTATRARGRCVLTGPGNRTVRTVLWKELRRIAYSLNAAGERICDVLGAEPALVPHTGMQWPDGREIIGFAAKTPETMQGLSGADLLFIIDEASGVPDDVFEAIEGNTAGGGQIAMASNPTKTSGFFFEAFHAKTEFYETITIASTETPNVTGLEPAIPGLAEPAWIAKQRDAHGETSSFYLVRVLGQFPGTAANAVIGLAAVQSAHKEWGLLGDPTEADGKLELGVDVARFGDDESVILPRRGLVAFPAKALQGFDTVAVAGAVVEVAREMRRPGEVVTIKVDTAGGYGAGVADLLRANHPEHSDDPSVLCLVVVDVNGAERASDPDAYVNLRSQLHFAVADWLKEGAALPPDKKLDAELLAPTYSFDARNRRKVESKDEIKKRLQRSPDRADALALAVLRTTHQRFGGGGGGGTDFEHQGIGGI